MAHFEHLLSQAELQSLEGATKWQSTTNDPLGAVQVSTSLPPAPASGASLLSLGVKQRVADQWTKGPLSSEELHLFRLFSSYRDVQWTKHSAARLRALYVLHAVNHIAKARDIMLANNARLNALDAKAERPELRDQGFSRPRVLILVPFRQSAVECVRLLLSLAPKAQKKEVAYRKRFNEEFGADAEEENEGWKEGKPADFVATFTGNTDDCFRLGTC